MIKSIWKKLSMYSLSRRGKIVVGGLAVVAIVVIVGWAA